MDQNLVRRWYTYNDPWIVQEEALAYLASIDPECVRYYVPINRFYQFNHQPFIGIRPLSIVDGPGSKEFWKFTTKRYFDDYRDVNPVIRPKFRYPSNQYVVRYRSGPDRVYYILTKQPLDTWWENNDIVADNGWLTRRGSAFATTQFTEFRNMENVKMITTAMSLAIRSVITTMPRAA